MVIVVLCLRFDRFGVSVCDFLFGGFVIDVLVALIAVVVRVLVCPDLVCLSILWVCGFRLWVRDLVCVTLVVLCV